MGRNDLCPRVAGCAGVAERSLGRVAILAGGRGDTMGAYPPHRARGVRCGLRVVCPHVAHRGYDPKLLMQDHFLLSKPRLPRDRKCCTSSWTAASAGGA